MKNHVNSRMVEGKIMYHVCMLTFLILLKNFLFEYVLSFQVFIATLKKVFPIVW